MVNRFLVQAALGQIFPGAGIGRISRWLGVNTRTLQRWMEKGGGQILDEDMPEGLKEKIFAMAGLVVTLEVDERLQDTFQALIDKGIPEEVLAAHIAAIYHQMIGREIE